MVNVHRTDQLSIHFPDLNVAVLTRTQNILHVLVDKLNRSNNISMSLNVQNHFRTQISYIPILVQINNSFDRLCFQILNTILKIIFDLTIRVVIILFTAIEIKTDIIISEQIHDIIDQYFAIHSGNH